MPPRPLPPHLLKPRSPEHRHKPHVPIAGRGRAHAVALDQLGPVLARQLHRGRQQLLGQALPAQVAAHKEAGDRPDARRRLVVGQLAQPGPMRVERRDGAPGHRLVVQVAQQAHRHAVLDELLHRCLAAGLGRHLGVFAVGAPGHAPAVAGAAAGAEEGLEVGPGVGRDRLGLELGGGGARFGHGRSTGQSACRRPCRQPLLAGR